jgi:hypothetical protein
MAFAPVARFAPLTVKVAEAEDPEVTRVAVPSVTPAVVKVTLPAGAMLPDEGFTSAVTVVYAAIAMVDGLAVATTLVCIGGATVTTAEPVEPLNPLLPA